MTHVVDNLTIEGRLQSAYRVEDFRSQATAASTLSLVVGDTSIQIFTGTTAAQIVKLPDATTLVAGRAFEIVNNSTQSIAVQDSGANLLRTVLPDTIAFFRVTNIGTANGVWMHRRSFITEYAQEVEGTSTVTTTSATDVLLTGVTLTPPRGTYRVIFTASMSQSANGNSNFYSIYVGGAQVASTERTYDRAGGADGMCSTHTIASVDGTQAIEIRWRRSSGTGSVLQRNFTVERID